MSTSVALIAHRTDTTRCPYHGPFCGVVVYVPRTSMSTDDGQVLGRLLLALGLVLVVVGTGTCFYVALTGGFDVEDPFGGSGTSDVPMVLLGFAALIGGALLAAVGGAVAKSVRRPGHHRSYGAYLDVDDDDEW